MSAALHTGVATDDRARRLVPAALGVAVVAISFAAIFFREAAPTHPLASAGIRLALVALVLAPVTLRAARRGRLRGHALRVSVGAGFAYAVHFGAWVASLELTSVAASVTLVTASPLILAVVGVAMRRDAPTPRMWAAIALGIAGLLLVGGGDLSFGPEALLGDGLALLGAGTIAVFLLLGRSLGPALDVWTFIGVAAAVGAAALAAVAWFAGVAFAPASWEAFGFLALATVFPHLVGHSLLTWCLKHTTPTAVGVATLGEPVGATLLAWAWLGEPVATVTAIGCAVTLAGVALAVVRPRRGRAPAPRVE